MRNSKNNSKLIIRKMANIFIKIGDIHANELSFGLGAYEPKISGDLLKNRNRV